MSVAFDSKMNSRKVHFELPTTKTGTTVMMENSRTAHSTKQYINGMLVSSSNTVASTQQNLQPAPVKQQQQKPQQQNFMITRSNPNLCQLPKTQNYLSSSCTPDIKPNVENNNCKIIPSLPKIEMTTFSSSMTNLSHTPYDTHLPTQYKRKSTNFDTLFFNNMLPSFTPTTQNSVIDAKNYLTVPDVDDYDNDADLIATSMTLYNKSSSSGVKPVRNEIDHNDFFTNEANHKAQVWNLFDRWRISRSGANTRKRDLNNKNSTQNASVSSHIYFKPHDKRSSLLAPPYRSYKMSLEKIPLVTTLLRAARDANDILLQDCLKQIKSNGISKEDLNAVDLNGRTALSYICSTSLTNILDDLLRIKDIDVNKPDNEGNTPLHFAAQAGIFDVINMLLTRCHLIKVDAKNNLGFTPLMKAALQGRTKCAKLLLFAGASPSEVDTGRGLRAEQWARFCGRYSCAEMIEKCARSRLLEKTTSCRWSHECSNNNNNNSNNNSLNEKQMLQRSKTNPATTSAHESQSTPQSPVISKSQIVSKSSSFRSKFRKVLPFGLSREKSKTKPTIDCNTDLVTYLTAAALCASGPALPSNGSVKIIKSIIRPLEVPKVLVTDENREGFVAELIKRLKHTTTEEEIVFSDINKNFLTLSNEFVTGIFAFFRLCSEYVLTVQIRSNTSK